jgi:NitT/TauT family transport system ATP-binding protein
MTSSIDIGFMPLVDASLLIAAHELGFAEDEGVRLNLIKESSWANIRDRMVVGHFQAAHMLAPLPLAGMLGMSSMRMDVIVPMALGLGGNAVTVSEALARSLLLVKPDWSGMDAAGAGQVLRAGLPEFQQQIGRKLVCGVVHPHSAHNYELRYWLAASGIVPDVDVEIAVVPPPLMPEAMQTGVVDLFCVGEPWNSVAVDQGQARVLTTKSNIWKSSPEKVLTVASKFATNEPEITQKLVRAVYRAGLWCADGDNHQQLAEILARSHYIGVRSEQILRSFTGHYRDLAGRPVHLEDFFLPAQRLATYPWQSHALWFYSQMVRWGQVKWDDMAARRAADIYRADIYRSALTPLSVDLPPFDLKVEGALDKAEPIGSATGTLQLGPDTFFDGRAFDPDNMEAYIAGQRQFA